MRVTAARRVLPLLLVLASVAVACGSDDGEDTGGAPPGSSSPSGRGLTGEEALAESSSSSSSSSGGGGSSPVEVRGALFVEGSVVRLCDAIMESFPPQCGGATLFVVGLDLGSVPLQSSDDGRVRWAEGVSLEGVVEGDELQV